jgi:predicted RNA-binding protein with TRAM domain
MGRDNRDRYGYRHRQDDHYEVGESKPGDFGDSKGTFHDRASSDNRVIVDGEVRSYEDHKRKTSQHTSKGEKRHESSKDDSKSKKDSWQSSQLSELDGATVEVTVDRISSSGNAIAEHRGFHVHVEDGVPGKTYEVKLTSCSGYFTGKAKMSQ